ncbi:DsbA family oxidoreductase [Parvibaculum sp.]|uniref:DsbA family oxidoreductase n=1 Tax=Parvibaculum sp. TaxID=2024848 RepID=UPI001AFEA2F5|nr:DsbA family oxidoreductase [Parvibaculum sp.]MBO6634432.1 DsbA family oxidoreductase [Parvibaculum sp.]MBO6679129.1 DsbA family oxidoreductase [Parvibaculum sp.]MBO6686312.1 DsbA family oxidoreductase [Parvibaculum sp.]MBO6904135.1 DsbA family oxidoreductase [Parvibaculum sp.]
MQLDVVSDTVCPWCYIGKKRLDQALEMHGGKGITLVWRPFQLDASIPEGGVDRKEYMEKKFGTERAKTVGNTIREFGVQVGIEFRFDRIERSPNTLDSHRLIRWAGTAGCQNEMVDILFRRYFEDGEDIGSHDVLIDAAAEAQMDTDIVRDLLTKDADKELIRREDELARQMGIQGVPSFVVNSQWVMVGAQEPETLVKMFNKLLAREAEAAAAQ